MLTDGKTSVLKGFAGFQLEVERFVKFGEGEETQRSEI